MFLKADDLKVIQASARKIIADVNASNMHRDVARGISVEAATILRLCQTPSDGFGVDIAMPPTPFLPDNDGPQ